MSWERQHQHVPTPPKASRMGQRTVLALLVLAVGLAVTDRLLTRPDRIARDALRRDLVSARDEILRYQQATGGLPVRLEDLVPRHLRADQLVAGDRPRYAYDPLNRTIRLSEPPVIRGLLRRRARVELLDLPQPSTAAKSTSPQGVLRLSVGTDLVVPRGPVLSAPPPDAYVLEAELFSECNYGWEVHPDPEAAGGAYLHAKEGIANGPGQIHSGVFNFHDIEEKPELTVLKIHFRLPKAGHYNLFGRFWTTGSHCSNHVVVGLDEGGPRPGEGCHYFGSAMKNTTPFQWLWTPAGGKYLEAGDHFIQLYLHEDGERIDQFLLTPGQVGGDQAFAANLPTEVGTAFSTNAPVVGLSFDLSSVVMTQAMPPSANVVLRSHRVGAGDATLRLFMDDTAWKREYHIDLAALPPLSLLPIDFAGLELDKLPRREYLLRAELDQHGQTISTCRVPMMHPFRWEVSQQLPYIVGRDPGPADGETESAEVRWEPFRDGSFDHFGVLDFGMQTTTNSLHAPELCTIYARTEIVVPTTGPYLIKLQSDDKMLLWLDGKEIHFQDEVAPVTRSVMRLPVLWEAGRHTLRMRVNQVTFSEWGDGRWQASLRVRTPDDKLSDVIGATE